MATFSIKQVGFRFRNWRKLTSFRTCEPLYADFWGCTRTSVEMATPSPLKWNKYELLVKYGLIGETELRHQVARFSLNDTERLIADIDLQLTASKDASASLFVIKLVSQHATGQLPNYRVTSRSDLSGLRTFISRATDHVEIWCCRTPIDQTRFSVAGRLVVQADSQGQILEQVWRASPRLIEAFACGGDSKFEHPFYRATRPSWGWRFRPELLYAPTDAPCLRRRLQREADYSLRLIEQMRERLEPFTTAILEVDRISVLSIEYKIVDRRVVVIDWDTAFDRRVLEAL